MIDVYASVDDEHQPIECPVCHQTGLLTGNSFIDYDVETENDDGSYHAYVVGATVLLLPHRFSCPYCGFVVTGNEELEEVNLGDVLELRNASPEDMEADADQSADDYDSD